MSLWQCKIISRRFGRITERTEIIDSNELLTPYVQGDIPNPGDEVVIVIQHKIPQPRSSESPKKPWWKFW